MGIATGQQRSFRHQWKDLKAFILGVKRDINDNIKALDKKLDLMGNKIEQIPK